MGHVSPLWPKLILQQHTCLLIFLFLQMDRNRLEHFFSTSKEFKFNTGLPSLRFRNLPQYTDIFFYVRFFVKWSNIL